LQQQQQQQQLGAGDAACRLASYLRAAQNIPCFGINQQAWHTYFVSPAGAVIITTYGWFPQPSLSSSACLVCVGSCRCLHLFD